MDDARGAAKDITQLGFRTGLGQIQLMPVGGSIYPVWPGRSPRDPDDVIGGFFPGQPTQRGAHVTAGSGDNDPLGHWPSTRVPAVTAAPVRARPQIRELLRVETQTGRGVGDRIKRHVRVGIEDAGQLEPGQGREIARAAGLVD